MLDAVVVGAGPSDAQFAAQAAKRATQLLSSKRDNLVDLNAVQADFPEVN